MIEVDKKTLAGMFGVAGTTIDAYRRKGLPTVGEGRATKYNVQECFRWFNSYTVQQEREKWDTTPSGMTEQDAKTRKLTAEALIAELDLAKERGTMVNISDAEREVMKHHTIVRTSLLAFPVRTAPFLVMVPDELTARQIIEAEIFKLMDALSVPVEIEHIVEPEEEETEVDETDD
jgi:phage terminase Nu1 subunit (DNA packaging protein)